MEGGGDNVGFSVSGGVSLRSPVLVSVPHAGRDYPDVIFNALRLPRPALLRLEDRYADLLVRDLVRAEAPVIVAHRARAWIDLNRDEKDLDVEMVRGADRTHYPQPGAKQRGGLGLVPRRLSGDGELWKQPFDLADIEQRIASFHRPYHAQVADILSRMRAKFGVAILLDLHSMPPLRQPQIGAAPQFVIGDRFGQSAGSQYAELLIEQLKLRGFHAALNHPYAGEYILRSHASPKQNIHAIQLEVDRSLYLDSVLREPAAGLSAMAGLIGDLVYMLADQAAGISTLMAAE
ncbi:MAG TPA: N-formylglutamate amidohydrolase [Sphingorhabdus sp.]|nr:N-formylglutamate amidohydrolase [Sphingorhabdus sp.]